MGGGSSQKGRWHNCHLNNIIYVKHGILGGERIFQGRGWHRPPLWIHHCSYLGQSLMLKWFSHMQYWHRALHQQEAYWWEFESCNHSKYVHRNSWRVGHLEVHPEHMGTQQSSPHHTFETLQKDFPTTGSTQTAAQFPLQRTLKCERNSIRNDQSNGIYPEIYRETHKATKLVRSLKNHFNTLFLQWLNTKISAL